MDPLTKSCKTIYLFPTQENVATETLATTAANASSRSGGVGATISSSGLAFGWGNKGGSRGNEQPSVVDFSMPQQELKLLDIVRVSLFSFFFFLICSLIYMK